MRHGWEIIVECRRRRTQRVIFTDGVTFFHISIISISISIVSISISTIIIIFPDDVILAPVKLILSEGPPLGKLIVKS